MSEAKKSKDGYMTVVDLGGTQFAIFATSPDKLRTAFITITGGNVYFRPEMMDKVKVGKEKFQTAY